MTDLGSTQFTANGGVSSQQKNQNSQQSLNTEDCDRETQAKIKTIV
jgi:hypothetical protein